MTDAFVQQTWHIADEILHSSFSEMKFSKNLARSPCSIFLVENVGGSERVALAVAITFSPQIFGKVAGTYEWYFVTL